MFETLQPAKPDGILALTQAFRADPRRGKIDLGVGVYRDAQGRTPIMRAVKTAEARLLAEQDTKSYTHVPGAPEFRAVMIDLLLGGAVPGARIASVGTPGGTGAVRQVAELIAMARPGATVWLSAQTWPNHPGLIEAARLTTRRYRYLDADSGALDRAGLLADLDAVNAGDVVLMHGCCHNPTGIDPTPQDWAEIAAVLERRGAVPFIDMAYQGFGEGLDADAGGLRHLAARLPEVLVAASCSKNFGLYRDRVGLAMAIVPDAQTEAVQDALVLLNRRAFAFPPDHGACVVSTILTDPALRADWLSELDDMRARVRDNRRLLADELRAATGSDRFGFLAGQAGMFSILPLDPALIATLRRDHGIYMLGDGRINIAGLQAADAPILARAIAEGLRTN